MTIETRFIAFLRGINVGGRNKIGMAQLRAALHAVEMRDVRTVLASGNLSLATDLPDEGSVARAIGRTMKKHFGLSIGVTVRTAAYLQEIADSDPFARVTIDENTRLYVTFLTAPRAELEGAEPEGAIAPDTTEKPQHWILPELPYTSPEFDFTIVSSTTQEAFSVLRLTPRGGTTAAMALLEEYLGKDITTRNWNTIRKLLG